MKPVDRRNNFDLLRVLAALQVVHAHSVEHLHIRYGTLGHGASELLTLFPGVPIFFVISGFLISKSYERAPSVTAYARNRFLRIYPGLWVCFAASLTLLAAFGALPASVVSTPAGWAWIAGQLTFVQFFNPDALRAFGVGVLNGSLWTIPVELQFYVALPLLYTLCLRSGQQRTRAAAVAIMAALSFAVWCVWQHRMATRGADLAGKLVQVSLLPHLFMFLTGVVLQRRWSVIAPFFEGRAGWWMGAYLGERLVERVVIGAPAQVSACATVPAVLAAGLSFALLAATVLSVAYTCRSASRVLRGHDVSYGIYIYHMLAINALVQLGFGGSLVLIPVVVGLVVAVASASWIFVERPSLGHKKGPVRPRIVAAAAPAA